MSTLKIGDMFTVTQKMIDYEKHNTTPGHAIPEVGSKFTIKKIENCISGRGNLLGNHCISCDARALHENSISADLKTGSAGWERKITFTSKSNFKIEKDKIIFPNGEQSTFHEFTKKYNAMRQVYRKLSTVKKEFNL